MMSFSSERKVLCEEDRLATCFVILLLNISYSIISYAQDAPAIEWQKCLGGTAFDVASCIQPTADGGFIIAGHSYSSDGDVTGNHGDADYWVVKLNSTQDIEWEKSLGGSGEDEAFCVLQSTEGGFIVAGASASSDGDVSGNHGDFDCWIVKLDADGNLVWEKSLGGSDHDHTQSIQQTADGGYIVGGHSMSTDGDVSENHGDGDYWIVKLDGDGNIQWEKSYGGSKQDFTTSIQLTTDGGFIVAGWSLSNDGDVSGNHGSRDYWVIRLDSTGNLIWQKSLGGSNQDAPNSLSQTADGGFIIAGYTASSNGDVSGNHGSWDYWIVKLDSNGNLLWQKTLGGTAQDEAKSVQRLTDGGFVVAGSSESDDDEVSGNHGHQDSWIAKLDSSGNLLWQESLGGSDDDKASFIQPMANNAFIIAGGSYSNDDEVSGNHGDDDCWIVKLKGDIATSTTSNSNIPFSIYPNPAQNQLTICTGNLPNSFEDVSIRVYDLEGRTIALPATISKTQVELTTTEIPEGFYTFQITESKTGKSEMGKFMKQL